VALLLAHSYGTLAGVTTVAGNAPLEATTRNALIVADVVGYTGPVVPGAERPLVADPQVGARIHGASGLDGPDRREPSRGPERGRAAQYLIEAATPDTWVVATGPLTNIAAAVRLDARWAGHIAGISVMGGSTSFGNVSAVAEFNIAADPEAAYIVLSSGANLRICGLNLTHQVLVDPGFVSSVRALGTPAAGFFGASLDFFLQAYAATWAEPGPVAPIHDACAVLAVTHPQLFGMRRRHVAVELTGTLTRGMTVVDQRPIRATEAANAAVAETVDALAVLGLIRQAVAAIGG
jgi:inosine-uridine nucleoside N-ribohydrolase